MYIQQRHAQTDWPSTYWSHTDPFLVLVLVELLTRDNSPGTAGLLLLLLLHSLR